MIKKINRRETFNDIYVYDTYVNKWFNGEIDDFTPQRNENKKRTNAKLNSMAPNKRMNHASCVYGGIVVISGGIYGEDN